jgi:hypothetical protein
MTGSGRIEAFEAAMSEAGRHRAAGDAKSAFAALERGHVLGQLDFVPHLRVHWQMLRLGWSAGDRREVTGQLMRIALVPVGHLLGRLPATPAVRTSARSSRWRSRPNSSG